MAEHLDGPVAYPCPHCGALPGMTCVSTYDKTQPFRAGGVTAQHLLRWIRAHDVAREHGFEGTMDEFEKVMAQPDAQEPVNDLF